MLLSIGYAEQVASAGEQSYTVHQTFASAGAQASGTCRMDVTLRDSKDHASNTLMTPVTF